MENSVASVSGIDHSPDNLLFLTFFFQLQESKYQFFFALTESTTSPRLYLRQKDGGGIDLSDTSYLTGMPSTTNASEMFLFSIKMAESASAIFNDGSLVDSSFLIKRDPITHIHFGKTSHNLAPSNALYGEFIMYRGNGTHRLKVEGYIAHKFNYASNLPNSHAYKSSAPIRFTS
jgi:hypothetical protein